ncbi:hypothetical protein CC2G_008406 [Coprinopsis cinerea AmutBmut pab1-1]|nr:hypothetical protein CC2G_008406 [Coprinopsis cinerea AmutBmut pab1-1]
MSSRTTRSSAKKQGQPASATVSPTEEQVNITSPSKSKKRALDTSGSPVSKKKARNAISPTPSSDSSADDVPLSQLVLSQDKGKGKEVDEDMDKTVTADVPEECEEDFEDPFKQLGVPEKTTMFMTISPSTRGWMNLIFLACPMLLDTVRDPYLVRRKLYEGVLPVKEGSLKTWKTTGDDPTPVMSISAWQKILPKTFALDLLVQCLTFFISGEYYNPSFADATEFVVRSIVIYRFNFTRYELHRPKIGIVAGVSVIGVVESKLRAEVDTRFISGIMNRGHWERWNGFYATVFNHDNLQAQVVGTKIQFQTKSRFEGGGSDNRAGASYHTDNPFGDVEDKSYKSPVKQKNSVRRMAPYNHDEDVL